MVRTFAAIDVGSFELELGIYEITDKGSIRSVDQVKTNNYIVDWRESRYSYSN